MEILKVNELTKVYGKGENEVRALDGVSFSVEKGEFIAIVGPSGSGKSTLLHILGGVDRPTSGQVYMNGQDVYKKNEEQLAIFRRREVGLIYQFYNLIPVLNVVENITLPILMDKQNIQKERLDEIIEVLNLKGREGHLPSQLSGGQQQRVSIGRALINMPAIVLADEPTGNLDRKNSQEIIELLKMTNRKYNQTVIVITHDENIALQADRIITIEHGKIIKDVDNLKLFRAKSRGALNSYIILGYPSATSSIIIRVKPRAAPIVPILECSPSWDSGINSSITT